MTDNYGERYDSKLCINALIPIMGVIKHAKNIER